MSSASRQASTAPPITSARGRYAVSLARASLGEAVLAGEEIREERWRIRRSDGSDVLAIGSARRISRQGGAPLGAVLTLRDDTARQAAEEAVRASEARYRSLVDASTSIVWTTDATGAFITPQPSWEAYTGQPFEQHRGFGWAEMLHQRTALASWPNGRRRCHRADLLDERSCVARRLAVPPPLHRARRRDPPHGWNDRGVDRHDHRYSRPAAGRGEPARDQAAARCGARQRNGGDLPPRWAPAAAST